MISNMNTKTKANNQEIRKILKDNNYDFKSIYQNKDLRDKVNLLNFDFEGAKKIAEENKSIEFIDLVEKRI